MIYDFLKIDKQGQIVQITITKESSLNALNTQLLNELEDCVRTLIREKEIRVVIFTGSGKAFVAGADIEHMKELNQEESLEFSKHAIDLFNAIEEAPFVTISAINGFALGGGCELAMATDIRIASEKAKFGQPEVGLGITPGFGGTQRLTRLVGIGKAKELIFTASLISAEEAKTIGLVNQVVKADQLMETAMETAQMICSNSGYAIYCSKLAIHQADAFPTSIGFAKESNQFSKCFTHPDQKEGMAAFLEKRQPVWEKRRSE